MRGSPNDRRSIPKSFCRGRRRRPFPSRRDPTAASSAPTIAFRSARSAAATGRRGHRQMLKKSAADGSRSSMCAASATCGPSIASEAADDVQKMFGTKPKTFKYSEEIAGGQGTGRGDDRHRRPPARADPGGSGARRQGLLLREADGEHARGRQAGAGHGEGQQAGGADGLAVAERSVPAARAGDRAQRQAGQDRRRSARAGTSTVRAGTFPTSPDIAAIREQDTDWNRWLLGRTPRPFDPRVYFEFRIFKDFSGGITDQWYSHGSGLAHFYLDTFIPDDTVSNGGIFAWHDVRENPDTFQCVSTFAEKQVLYTYSTTFGSGVRRSHDHPRHARDAVLAGRRGQPAVVVPRRRPKSAWGSNVVFDLQDRERRSRNS